VHNIILSLWQGLSLPYIIPETSCLKVADAEEFDRIKRSLTLNNCKPINLESSNFTTINLFTRPMSAVVKTSFVQFGMELPICRTENVNTQFHNKLLFINFKSLLPRINIFIQNNLYDLGSLSVGRLVF
jgi:hypothetical protein